MSHRYEKHKLTKHRTLEIPRGFRLHTVEQDPYERNAVRVVFKKKGR